MALLFGVAGLHELFAFAGMILLEVRIRKTSFGLTPPEAETFAEVDVPLAMRLWDTCYTLMKFSRAVSERRTVSINALSA